jgi:hypothetical protein
MFLKITSGSPAACASRREILREFSGSTATLFSYPWLRCGAGVSERDAAEGERERSLTQEDR